jgi:hypothetical protein
MTPIEAMTTPIDERRAPSSFVHWLKNGVFWQKSWKVEVKTYVFHYNRLRFFAPSRPSSKGKEMKLQSRKDKMIIEIQKFPSYRKGLLKKGWAILAINRH